MTQGGWRKSSFSSGGETDCVEVSLGVEHARVRDSKNADGPVLTVTPAAWGALVGAVDLINN
ncbi:DUF397 domain-containing protein [Actinokineospora xionganensis]|nr:DUF397 domain-containing protein [Actinokineospora xionganensis]